MSGCKYVQIQQADIKLKEIIYCFSQDLTAIQTADLLNLNRNTINRYYQIFRKKILAVCEEENRFEGKLEVDDIYFGGKHHNGKRGRGSENKILFLGILKRNGKSLYTNYTNFINRNTFIYRANKN